MADQDNKNQGKKKDDKKTTIDLSKALAKEEKSVAGDDILLDEEELLGIKPSTGNAKAITPTSSKAGAGGFPAATKTTGPASASKFHIPNIVREKYPKLIPLILETESMDNEEREYWFQILPIMTNDQVEKFREILISEKDQLAKLDAEYEQELDKINEKHLHEWQEFETKQKREELQKKEKVIEEEEAATEEDLLKKLEDL